MTVFMIEVKAARKSGPVADPDCYEDDIRELLDGVTIYPQDPDKDEETEVELAVVSFSRKS